jgi:hypothetical protein
MRRYLAGLISVIALSALGISCTKEKSLETGVPSQPGSGGSANYALSTNGPNCMNAVVSGVYKKGTATNTSNTVDIEVNVNTIGTWTMNSAGVAGYYFQGAGTFANTGTQTITLMAAGTPNMAGPQTFTLITGTTTCAFVVTVENDSTPTNPPPATGEYFPMTQGSWWSYDDGTGDTLKTTVSGTTVIAGKTYSNFVDSYEGIPDTDTSFYRKDNSTGFFYLNEDLSVLAALGITMSQPRADVLFMKNSLTTGATWNSDHAGTASGIPVTVRFKFNVLNANATTTIGSNTFTNVYQVQLTLQLGMLGTFTDMAAPATLSFAKGVGLIRTDDGTDTTDIRYWHVN